MGIPTVTAVDPNSGPTRGYDLVAVTGTNFRLPDPPPAGDATGDQDRTVKVSFGGVDSDWAYAASEELIYARVPEWRGDYETMPLPLAVRVANLDNDENEIPGENATLADGYTIDRPNLAKECYFQRACREIIRTFRRHVIKNTYMTVRRDYDEDATDWETLKASAPVIHLMGPRVPINRFDSVNREEAVEDPTDPDAYLRKKEPVTTDIEFDVQVWTSASPNDAATRTLMGILQSMLLMFRDVTELRIDINPDDPDDGYYEYDFHMPWHGYPDVNSEANSHDLTGFRAICLLKGVHIDEEAGTVIERGWIVSANDGEPTVEYGTN